jgi:DNA-binding protein H-NS
LEKQDQSPLKSALGILITDAKPSRNDRFGICSSARDYPVTGNKHYDKKIHKEDSEQMSDHSAQTASIDLQALSDDALEALIEEAHEILQNRKETQRREAIDEIQRLAAAHGLNVGIKQRGIRGRRSRKSNGPRAPKYRNPDNPEQTWSGVGPKPKWLKNSLAKGKTIEELEIPDN